MFKNESELLATIADTLKTIKSIKNYNNFNDIEKYRDKDGFINLTSVKDKKELNRIIDLVETKNFIEELENNTNLQEKAEGLAKSLKDMFNVDSVKVKISTTDGESFAEVGSDKENNEIIEETSDKGVCVNDSCCENDKDNKEENLVEKIEDKFIDESVEDNRVVVLYNVGGMSFNAPYFNAVLHICENEYFNECGVYGEDETYPEKVDTHILLPNIWCKITTGAIEHFIERMGKGENVYVIDPEFFELHEIVEPYELWDYSMTITQEHSI